jgi:hypothetical protein
MPQIIRLCGSFGIEYVPEDKIYDYGMNYHLPLTARITLGETALGLNATPFYSVGSSFSAYDYLYDVLRLYNGEDIQLTLHEQKPIPLLFTPHGNLCTICLDGLKCTNLISSDINLVETQVVSLEKAVFKLADFMNDFLIDLDNRKAYTLLDMLELEIGDIYSEQIFEDLFSRFNTDKYHFKTGASTQRSLSQIMIKKQLCDDYSDFLDSLSQRESADWEKYLATFEELHP